MWFSHRAKWKQKENCEKRLSFSWNSKIKVKSKVKTWQLWIVPSFHYINLYLDILKTCPGSHLTGYFWAFMWTQDSLCTDAQSTTVCFRQRWHLEQRSKLRRGSETEGRKRAGIDKPTRTWAEKQQLLLRLLLVPGGFADLAVHASTGHSADNKHVWCWLLLGCQVPTKPPWSRCWGTHPSRPPQLPHDLISALWFSALVYCIGTTFILNCNQLAQKNRTQ